MLIMLILTVPEEDLEELPSASQSVVTGKGILYDCISLGDIEDVAYTFGSLETWHLLGRRWRPGVYLGDAGDLASPWGTLETQHIPGR